MKVLTARKVSIQIDKEDFKKANKGKSLFVKANGFVIISRRLSRKVVKHFYLHKIIMDCPQGYQVDHINGNRLDNRKKNLRICTHQQNQFNKPKRKNTGVSKYKGVFKHYLRKKKRYMWGARITVSGKNSYDTWFLSERKAAQAYDRLAVKHHGEFARLNFPRKKKS